MDGPQVNAPWRTGKKLLPRQLHSVYRTLRKSFGHQSWWPGDSPIEIIVGAILTQNTAWVNVEKAIRELKRGRVLSVKGLRLLPHASLAKMIRSSGYFNLKATRLKSFIAFLDEHYGGSLTKMFREPGDKLRANLLSVKGIGPETADSILLYAGEKPFFVIDTYTKRVFSRHKVVTPHENHERMTYNDWQALLMTHLPRNTSLYNDYHAQIVEVAKRYCKASIAQCTGCPLSAYL